MKVFEALEVVKKRVNNKHKKNREYGICGSLESVMCAKDFHGDRIWSQNKNECFTSWPHWCGSKVYPIPSSKTDSDRYHAERAFCDAHEDAVLWHKTTEYGRLRHDLLDHCIAWFKERNL